MVDQRHDPSWWGGGHREAGLTVSFPVVPSLKSHLRAGCPAKRWDAAMQGGIGGRGVEAMHVAALVVRGQGSRPALLRHAARHFV